MKKTLGPILLAAAWCAPALLRAAPPSPFSPEPPEPAAAALVEAYLPLLAAGEFEQALAWNDLRGMRQYLLERRLADLKAKTPELTAQDLEDMSAQLQLNELNPARLQVILLDLMKEAAYEGMTWRIRGYAPAPEADATYLVGVDARTAEGRDKPVWLGIRKLGDQWRIAPDLVEALGRRQTAVHMVPPEEVPGAVAERVHAFWKHWQTGDMNEAYALLGSVYRARMPLLAFLQQAQPFLEQTGVPVGWQIVQGLESGPVNLAVGVNLQGSIATLPTLMVFRKTGETWVLDDLQLQMPRLAPAGAAPPPAPRPFRPDLKPAPAPAISPVSPPADTEEPRPGPAGPAQPTGPVGPDAP